ncbi:MAG: carbohydrate-binding protein [Prolixibacteraceae bacterium]|nr:carbohydrate-binding protein [Prolixibacteraceae bacterium]
MLQEGYMMQTSDIAGTQHEFRQRLVETIGEAKTDSFYNAWLHYHFTRTDVDSMKSWGYNTVRVAMHYKWFTPPIEDEPVQGEITWKDKGFVMIDSLLDWCADNQMYLILDLHGAPGGQGKDSNISDYDPSKPSLWESELNQDKTVALWRKLAERYANEPWMGGYDLINETNWEFSEANNAPLRRLYNRITEAIREVDTNHIIYIEGNWFANDFSGLTPPWDDNMVYSFHKYWNYNTPGSIGWVLDLRETYNVPIWLGETGENSNTWFTNLVSLCEKNDIGWSWWPVKKPGINNPLRVEVNEDYTRLIEYWKGEGPALSEEEAFEAVLQFAENHKIENCILQKDVVDAKIRQPHTTETIPYTKHHTTQKIFFTDYDLGRNNYAYFDNDTANYRLEEGQEFVSWNQGWLYRNDGVDIEPCSDDAELTNGYNVGWTEDGEWMQYTVKADSSAAYDLEIRYASNSNSSKLRFFTDGGALTKSITLPSTNGWQNWDTYVVENVVFPAGWHKIKVLVETGGVNLNYFALVNPESTDGVSFSYLGADVSYPGNTIQLYLNKNVDTQTVKKNDFQVVSSDENVTIESVDIDTDNPRILNIVLTEKIGHGNPTFISYSGNTIKNGETLLETFENVVVENLLPVSLQVPGRIQAEDFFENNGLELEDSQDTGGGKNTGYANPGDYLVYNVEVNKTSTYKLNYRVATERYDARLIFQVEKDEEFISVDTIHFQSTNGWQSWTNQHSYVNLEEGVQQIRLWVLQSEFNLNWFDFEETTSAEKLQKTESGSLHMFPGGRKGRLEIQGETNQPVECLLYNAAGQLALRKTKTWKPVLNLEFADVVKGAYVMVARCGSHVMTHKVMIL